MNGAEFELEPARLEGDHEGRPIELPVRVECVALVDQDADLEMLVKGARAKMLYDAVQKAQREQAQTQPSEAILIISGLAIAVILAAVVMLGFMMLYAVLTQAMNKGYDVKDTKYKAVTGEGESRQEHEMLFNLTQPGQ